MLPQPGEPATVYVMTLASVGSDVTVFIHRGGMIWEYGGEYKCILQPLNAADFRSKTPE
ncbi:hypothetical protein H0H87_008008, partial [Tephrocybe sp. NHM501043]